KRSLAIDPDDIVAITGLADIYSQHLDDLPAARKLLKRAKLPPDADTGTIYAELMSPRWLKQKEAAAFLKKNLLAIHDACRRKNIRLVLQTYPYPRGIEQTLASVAELCRIPLIDHARRFREIGAYGTPLDYFIEDNGDWRISHLNDAGYRQMALAVADDLEKHELRPSPLLALPSHNDHSP
ncbi:MAG TPA: hypothetical protein P5079_10015, partial [Elusimicrobiota bacterium]|nr:hypothetical protein [Elusimicrobiota bacterium]